MDILAKFLRKREIRSSPNNLKLREQTLQGDLKLLLVQTDLRGALLHSGPLLHLRRFNLHFGQDQTPTKIQAKREI